MLTKDSYKDIGFTCLKWGALALVLWLIVVFCTRGISHSTAPIASLLHDSGRLIVPKGSPLRQVITTHLIRKQNVTVPFTLPAVVQPLQTHLVKILPPISGRITNIYTKLGDKVKKGDVLLTLSSSDLAQAISDVEKAKATVALTRQSLLRQEKLIAAKIGSLLDQQQAINDYEQAASELVRAQTRLTLLDVNIDKMSEQGLLTLRAPISGSVIELNTGLGGYWNDINTPLMTIADLSSVYVIASVQEQDLNEIYLDQSAQIKVDAYPKARPAKVEYIGPLLNSETRTVEVGFLLANNKDQLKPNMFAKAILQTRMQERFILPLTAVIQRGFDSLVFVEVAPWQFESRTVQLGPQLDDHVEILSGLSANERVVYSGGIILND